MPHHSIMEEQKQVKHIIRRLKIRYTLYYLPFCLGVSILLAILMYKDPKRFISPLGAVIMLSNYIFAPFFVRWAAKRTARRLSQDQYIALERAAEIMDDSMEKKNINALLKAGKRYPEKELLRASQPSQDDTLLRAAQYTDNAPQEQLLRPSQDAK